MLRLDVTPNDNFITLSSTRTKWRKSDNVVLLNVHVFFSCITASDRYIDLMVTQKI